jgi:haloalkane dehalogenase
MDRTHQMAWNLPRMSVSGEETSRGAYADWLKTSNVPKLFLKAEPGGILAGGKVLEHARSLPAQTEVTVAGVHFVQEDSPDEIGPAIAGWMGALA